MNFTWDCLMCFNNLSTKNRLEIVNLLQAKGSLTASEINQYFELGQPTISHHLNRLKNAGIVDSKRQGKYTYYKLINKCPENKCGLFT